jgi:hypothetical protein
MKNSKQIEFMFDPEQEERKRFLLDRAEKSLRSVLVFNEIARHYGREKAEQTFHRPTVWPLLYILEGLKANNMKIADLKPAKGLEIYIDWLEKRDREYISITYMELISYLGGYKEFKSQNLFEKFEIYFN